MKGAGYVFPTYNGETYSVDANCTNCGHNSRLRIPVGNEKPKITTCPVCKCHTFKTGW